MPNVIAKITKYLPQVVDKVFAEESKSQILNVGKKYLDLDFKEVGYVKILSILMDGLSDYYRANGSLTGDRRSNQPLRDGYKIGDVKTKWEILELRYDRGKQFQIDNMDNEETAGAVIANVLGEFLRLHVIPEKDITVFSTIASKAKVSLGNLQTAKTIAENKIVTEFNTGFEWLAEHEVPNDEQVIFVTPRIMNLIRNSTELTRYLGQGDLKSGDVTLAFRTYEGRPIIEVPTNRFFTDVELFDGGYRPSATSKVINYMIVSKKAVLPIVKLEKSKIFGPEVVQDFDGYKINFRLFHDTLIPANKLPGVYVSVSETTASDKTFTLAVDITKKGEKYVVEHYWSNPAGLNGTLVHSATALNIGEEADDATPIVLGTEYAKLGANEYYAIVDSNNVVIATTGQVTLP